MDKEKTNEQKCLDAIQKALEEYKCKIVPVLRPSGTFNGQDIYSYNINIVSINEA